MRTIGFSEWSNRLRLGVGNRGTGGIPSNVGGSHGVRGRPLFVIADS